MALDSETERRHTTCNYIVCQLAFPLRCLKAVEGCYIVVVVLVVRAVIVIGLL